MTGERDDAAGGEADQGARGRARLQAVHGPVSGSEPPPPIRLVREWKGVTVADLQCSELVERLPGQVLSALHHIERGDYAAAERALPGDQTPVLAGPGHRRRERRWLVAFVVIAATVAATALATWFAA